MTPAEKHVRADAATTISYTVFEGEGPTVMILHGLAGSSREFTPTAVAHGGRPHGTAGHPDRPTWAWTQHHATPRHFP